LISLLLVAALAGCSTASNIMESKKVDYKSAGKLPPLEIPPDLTAPTQDDRFAVPDIAPKGSATFSAYDKERSGQKTTTTTSSSPLLLPNQEKISIQRAGSQRWLVVRAKPDEVWPLVKEFWQENGFLVSIEKPEAGVMETDWAENRAKIPQDFIRNALGKVLDGLYSTAERDKFRTRLEAGAEADSTEVYISHRGMSEQLEGGNDSGRTIWQPRPADPELEAEFLRRLMVRFGVEQTRAEAMLASDGVRERARMSKAQDGISSLELSEPFDRAWRRVGLALDRVGFTVEDRDRSKGLYFVRYVDPDADSGKKEDKGLLSKLAFWKSDKKDDAANTIQYRIQVAETGGNSVIRVLDKAGGKEKSDTAGRILNLLHEQLK
jgi:outer membrane protein assembly factor BamC